MTTSFSKIFIASLLFLVSQITVSAQWYNPDKVNKKAANYYTKAYEEAIDGKYTEAIADLKKALDIEPKFVDVYLSRAGIYAQMHDYKNSVADFEKGMQMDYEYGKTYLLPYSISLAGIGEFQKALMIVNQFLEKPTLNEQSKKAGKYRKDVYTFALQKKLESDSEGYIFKRKNMGENINSTALEYFPSLTIDGTQMIFTRRQNSDEDFYQSNLVDGIWQQALPLKGQINTNFNEGAQNVSQDGQWLIFTGCNYPEGIGSCDLYIAYKTRQGNWTEPQNLGTVINSGAWESSPSLSPDKRHLYFSANRLGGYGGKDIWVTERNNKGVWSKPENLGPTVNTSGDEGCPFIHADNETLYFNSDGHPGYGMTDLFYVKKRTDSTWNTPVNLGYPINTIDDEGSLIVSSDGRTGYYASDGADTRGGLDLYTFQLPKPVRALETKWVKGQVYDAGTKEGLPSMIELVNLKTGSVVSRLQTDEDGRYLVTLPVGKDYAFSVNRKGYLFYSENYQMVEGSTDTMLTNNIPLQSLKKGAIIVLNNIFFEVNRSELQNESRNELDKIVSLMQENPTLQIKIVGYTDNIGTPAANQLLSENRAKSVNAYLIQKGISSSRLKSVGYGEKNPVADNSTEQGRAKNRRTELNVE